MKLSYSLKSVPGVVTLLIHIGTKDEGVIVPRSSLLSTPVSWNVTPEGARVSTARMGAIVLIGADEVPMVTDDPPEDCASMYTLVSYKESEALEFFTYTHL